MFDVIIVGGGPAGLSAALVLGRCRRKVLICDAGHPRNERSTAMHGFLSRDGMPPKEFLGVCREQLEPYSTVEFRQGVVNAAQRDDEGFSVTLLDGSAERAKILMLATGLVDELPAIPGIDSLYGRSIHHCPYCDGWEHRDEPLAVLGHTGDAVELAVELLLWSKDIVVCTGGQAALPAEQKERLTHCGIRWDERPIAALEGHEGVLAGIRFTNGALLPRRAAFFSPAQHQQSPLAEALGCKFDAGGVVECSEDGVTCVPGVFAVGNAGTGLQLVIVAAAEGTRAAFRINQALLDDADRDRGGAPACG